MLQLLLYAIFAVAATSAVLYIVRRRPQFPARLRVVLTVVSVIAVVAVLVWFILRLGGVP